MKKQNLGTIIGAGFAAVLLLGLIASFGGYRGLNGAAQSLQKFRALSSSSVLAGQLQASVLTLQIGVKDYVLTRRDEAVQAFDDRHKQVGDLLLKAKGEFTDATRAKELAQIEKNAVEFTACFHRLVVLFNNPEATNALEQAATARDTLKQLGDEMSLSVETIKTSIVADQEHLGSTVKTQAEFAVRTVLWVSVATSLLGIVVAWWITRSVAGPLRKLAQTLQDGAEQTASAAAEVSASSQTLAEGASEQAASLEETGASLEEMSSMTKRNADSAQGSKDLATQTRQAAQVGVETTRQMTQAMNNIKGTSQEMRTAMEGIKSASSDVSKIIKTIDEIAFQTNILALNAAVEAARAGEAGMGFAVVADEVRNLAQRSAKAAKETAGMIEMAIHRSEVGVQVNDRVHLAIEQITAKSKEVEQCLNDVVGKVQQLDEAAAEVALASKEQSNGISQVNAAVGQMDKVTQANAASAEESAAAAEELTAQASTLKHAVAELQSLVGGNDQAFQAAATPETAPARASKPAPRSRPSVPKSFGNVLARKDAPMSLPTGDIPMDGDFRDF